VTWWQLDSEHWFDDSPCPSYLIFTAMHLYSVPDLHTERQFCWQDSCCKAGTVNIAYQTICLVALSELSPEMKAAPCHSHQFPVPLCGCCLMFALLWVTSGYDKRWEFTGVNKLGSSVTEYALASSSIINNIFDCKIRVDIINTQRTLLLKL
jgi:hypothetical protein